MSEIAGKATARAQTGGAALSSTNGHLPVGLMLADQDGTLFFTTESAARVLDGRVRRLQDAGYVPGRSNGTPLLLDILHRNGEVAFAQLAIEPVNWDGKKLYLCTVDALERGEWLQRRPRPAS